MGRPPESPRRAAGPSRPRRPVGWVVGGLLVVTALVALAAWSGGGTARVAGRVTAGGAAVRGGTVTVVAADGSAGSAAVREDGSYEVRGLATGPARVEFTPAAGGPPGKGKARTKDGPHRAVDLPRPAPLVLKAGDNTYDIDLK